MITPKTKKYLFITTLVVAVIILAIASAVLIKVQFGGGDFSPKPMYKDITSYGTTGIWSECSQPIKGKLHRGVQTQVGIRDVYLPADPAEAKLFCHNAGYIEYEGKLTVLQRPEVLEMISKYEYKDVSIKALEFELIGDKDFVHRLLPDYKDEEIGCIIILQTPDGGMVYLEDEELETFEEMDYQKFMQYLDKVSPSDRQLFLDNLQ